jgi:2',3'-cyclic-nucleotide 2'-phosphodiesterase (5'-nucleotidase family)
MAPSTHRLTIICINDVYSFDDSDGNSTNQPRGGWSRASSLIKSLKLQHGTSSSQNTSSTVLTSANGDVLGGSSFLQHTRGSVAVQVMNSIPIDLAVLGNHEFDFGDEELVHRIRESECKWLGSNVYYHSSGEDDDAAYFPGVYGDGIIYNLNDNLKLGVFGLCTKQTPKISYPSDRVQFDPDVITVARRTCSRLRSQGAHVIVAITHMSEEEDLTLAKDVEAGVDLIVGGHEHEPFSTMIHREQENDGDDNNNHQNGNQKHHNQGGVLVFKCGMNAYWVGSVHLDIEYDTCSQDHDSNDENSQQQQSHTRVNSIATSYSMHAVSSQTPEDTAVNQIVQTYRQKTEKAMLVSSFGDELASRLHLDDVVATIASQPDSNNNSNSTTIPPLDTRMSSVRRRESTGSNLIADAMHWFLKTNIQSEYASHPMLAMINGGFIRADRVYPPGHALTVRQLLKELPFPRGMVVLKIEGRHLKDALGQQLKGSSKGPTGAFPHLSYNARMKYEISSPTSSSCDDEEVIHIQSLTVDGSEVSDTQEYLIAVTGFVADGSEGCTSWLNSRRIENDAWREDRLMCFVVLRYLKHCSVIVPRLEGRMIRL